MDVLTWSRGRGGRGRCSDLVPGQGEGVDVLTWSRGGGGG